MKTLLFIFYLSFLIACNNDPVETNSAIDYAGFTERKITPVGYKKKPELRLTDTICDVIIKLPQRFDSFYSWHNFSDCLGCGDLEYRFSDKSYPVFKEAGFLWAKNRPDSVYQFTIRHNEIKQAPDTMQIPPIRLEDTAARLHYLPHHLVYDNADSIHFLRKNFALINGRRFVIATFIGIGRITEKETLFVAASTTTMKRDYLDFIGECCTKDTTGFIETMYKTLASIQISERP